MSGPATTPSSVPALLRGRARMVQFGVALVGASVLAGGFAVVLRIGTDHAIAALFGEHDVLSAFRAIPWWARLASPAVGALLGALVAQAATRLPEAQGVGDVLEAVVLGRGRISFRAAMAKALASFFAIVGGGSLGREGPIIQVGAAIAGSAGHWARLRPSDTRVLIAAGTAAGFAAAYNTPIAATLFVLEIVTGVMALEVVVPVFVAAAISTTIARLALGEGPFYGLRTYALVTPTELASSIALGPLGGLAGVALMQMLTHGEKLFERAGPRVYRATLGGLVVGALAIGAPEVTGNGAEVIREMLDGRVLGVGFLVLLFAKPVATTASVSSGSAGGVFTPSMFIGAALGGGLASMFLGGAGADRDPVVGAFALVGMAAVVAATTHAPLMATVLAFEMSGDYALVVPLLAATALATGTARALRRDSIYTAEVRRNGVHWDGSIAHRVAKSIRARDLLEPAVVLEPDTTLERARTALLDRRVRVVYCALGDGLGAIDLRIIAGQRDLTIPLSAAARPVEPAQIGDDVPSLSERLWTAEQGEVPVLEKDGSVAGIVTRRGLLGALDRELLQRDLLVTRLTWSEKTAGVLVELPRGHRVAVVDAPPAETAAETGAELDLSAVRERRGVWVLAVRSGGARTPWRDSFRSGPVRPGDRWLVVGAAPAIELLGRR